MSRKSLPKKNPQLVWFNCDKCLCKILTLERDHHDKNCPNLQKFTNLSYIFDNKLFSTTMEKKLITKELEDISLKQLNSLIFISENVMKLCGFYIGEYLSITCPAIVEMAPIARMAWPLEDTNQPTIFFSEEDLNTNWIKLKDHQLKIEKLSDDPIPVNEITMEISDSDLSHEFSMTELSQVLQIQLRNLVFCIGNEINYNFYNKLVKLTIKSYRSQLEKDNETLENKFENLSLDNQKFLLTTHKTRIIILQDSTNNIVKVPASECNEIKICKSDVGGLADIFKTIEESIFIALGIQKIPTGISISRGILLYGPSGCGKSMICEALVNQFQLEHNAHIIRINTSEIFSKFFGETERNLEEKFKNAFKVYPRPVLIVLEDINNICPKHETNEITKRVSISFFNLMDSLQLRPDASKTFVLASTNNLENLNSGIRRCGRLDTELEISAPNPKERFDILKKQFSKVKHNLDVSNIKDIADATHGFVGSDLVNLMYKAAMKSLSKLEDEKFINLEDINYALSQIKPSAMREVLIENPNVKWEDIGGQHELKLKLKQAIEWPLLYPDKFERLGIKPPRGILMFGPPGCSKTMIAKALATESQVNFLSVKGPELFSMWVGESERAVREIFRKARQVAPAIIFFDEIDAIGGERSSDGQSASVKERVLTQLLTELDGVDTLKDVTIVAATNRPDMIDKALLRPGRIDRIVYVGLPDEKAREEILNIKLKKMPLSVDVILKKLVERTDGYSGAEIAAVCHEAALKSLEKNFDAQEVSWIDFEKALNTVKARTSQELLEMYQDYLKS